MIASPPEPPAPPDWAQKCAHCGNDQPRMLELGVTGLGQPIVFCKVCSKMTRPPRGEVL